MHLLLCCRGLYILDDEVHVHHRLFPLVSLLGDFLLSLLLGLGLTDDNASLQVLVCFAEMLECLLGILPIHEADKAEAFGFALVIFHDAGTQDLAEGFEKLNEITVVELFFY